MGRTWGDRAGLPCVVPGVPSPGAGDAADMRPGVGAGAGRWGFAGSCGTAQGASISRWSRGDSRGGVGAAEVARSTSPLQAGRRAESSDGSGSGAAPREAGGRKRVGEGPAAPRQSPSPFPFGCSDVAGAAGQRGAAVSLGPSPLPSLRGASISSQGTGVGAGVGAAPPGRAGALQALACPKPVPRDTAALSPLGQTLTEV